MEYRYAVYTDPGTKKKVNQDSCSIQIAETQYGQAMLAVVCDGVGGLKSGEQASASVVKKLTDWFENDFPVLLERKTPFLKIKDHLFEIISDISLTLKSYGQKKSIQLGTTIAMVLAFSGKGLLINVGDSRIYCFRNNAAHMLSHDQTVAQREVERGKLSRENALQDKRSHVLLQCIGASETVEPDFSVVNIESGDVFLVCTDGFYRKTNDNELVFNMASSIGLSEPRMKQALMLISDMVKNRGEPDNITAVMVKAE